MKRKALGKGLSSLIPDKPPSAAVRSRSRNSTTSPDGGLLQIDLDLIHPNKAQPREQFDQVQLEELAHSLQKQGVLQPVIVRSSPSGGYELIAGERRWRAAQIAGLLKVPAIVKDVSDDQVLELALIENLQREELNPVEEARAYQTLIDDLDLTQQEVADRVGKRRATVANALRLLNLPDDVQQMIRAGQITAGHAKALAGLTRTDDQLELARRIYKDGLSVRHAEQLAGRLSRGNARLKARTAKPRDPNVEAAEQTLQAELGTRVRIVQARKGGRLEIHYYSDEELQRVYDLVLKGARK
jgi:ParB family chromosome partitioning protein